MIKTIFLDLDGVIVDILGGTLKTFNVSPTPEIYANGGFITNCVDMDKGIFWKQIASFGPDWWENLQPYPWYKDLIKALKSIGELYILTSPPNTAAHSQSHAGTGKMRWIAKHLGNDFRNFILCYDKYLLAAPNRLLIDDRADHCNLFEEHGGQSILFAQPWNYGTHDADSIIRMIHNNEMQLWHR